MSLTPRPDQGRRRLRPLVIGTVTAGLLGGWLPLTATAAPAGPESPAAQSAAVKALKRAEETGKPVEVVSERGEFSSTFANPSGTFTQETYAVPVRVRQNGRLADADPTLVRDTDGTVRPRAASVGMAFSGGGDSAMATIRRDGRSMSLGWDGKLPKPVLDGDTATYPEVLPDVDLKLRVGITGFQQLLVVKSREAAADPRIAELSFPVSGDGVQVRTDSSGNLSAVNPAGQEVFTAPTPLMWDSSGSPENAEADAGRTRAPALDSSGEDTEDSFTRTIGAKEDTVPVTVEDGVLKLTPRQDLLTAEDTVFPVHIDPFVSGARNNWTAVSKVYPSTSFWNQSDNVARVGYESDTGGTWRSLFTMDTRNLAGKSIVSSTFRIKETHSWSCTKKPVDLYATGAISSATTWNKMPSWPATPLATVTDAKGWSTSACPAGNLEFNVKSNAVKVAAGKTATMTLGLQANEKDTYGWKKFDAKTAVLSTEYNSPPDAPSALDTVPSTKNAAGCGDTAPYGFIGDTDIQLTAKASDPDGGTVNVKFNLWATGHHPNDDPNGVLIVNQSVAVTSGSIARLTVAKSKLTPYLSVANGNFSWKAQAGDGQLTSDWTPAKGAPGCRFVFIPTRPSNPPAISSPQFPNGSAGWPANTSPVRTKGVFTLTPGAATDIASYEYWSTMDAKVVTKAPSALNGSVTVELTPVKAGPQYLYARGLDRAGNRSDTQPYLFYANGAQTPDKPGDINGDGYPDLWAVDSVGTLQRYFGDGTGNVVKVSEPASPAGRYKDALTTRRGDWTDDGYEDLIALFHDAAEHQDRLWIEPNDGTGAIDPAESRELRVWEPENDHWQGADQILAIDDVDGPLDLDGDGVIGPDDRPAHPDLLVKKGDQLWLYYGSPSGRLDEYADQPPVLLGDGGWSALDLAAPGKVSEGTGGPAFLGRDRTTGELYQFTATGPQGEGLGSLAGRTQVGSGWTAANHPLYTAIPDMRGDGRPGLYATGGNGDLYTYAGVQGTGTVISNGFQGFRSLN